MVKPSFGNQAETTSNVVRVRFYKAAITRIKAKTDSVRIKNTGKVAVHLSGWKLRNAKTGQVAILPAVRVAAGRSVWLVRGSGPTTRTRVFVKWGNMWRKHAKAVLRDDARSRVDVYRY